MSQGAGDLRPQPVCALESLPIVLGLVWVFVDLRGTCRVVGGQHWSQQRIWGQEPPSSPGGPPFETKRQGC